MSRLGSAHTLNYEQDGITYTQVIVRCPACDDEFKLRGHKLYLVKADRMNKVKHDFIKQNPAYLGDDLEWVQPLPFRVECKCDCGDSFHVIIEEVTCP